MSDLPQFLYLCLRIICFKNMDEKLVDKNICEKLPGKYGWT